MAGVVDSLAGAAAHQADLVAVHAFQRDEFCCEVIAVYGFFTAVAYGTRKEPVPAAHLTR